MTTFAELKTRVQRLVIDLPTAVQTEVPVYINEAMREVQEHNFKVMEALSGPNSTTVSTRNLMAVPSNFKEYRDEPYFLQDSGLMTPMQIASDRKSVLTTWENDEDGEPMALLESEPTNEQGTRNWEVWPLPDGLSDWDNGEYRIYIPYWKYLTALSADGDNNWLTNNGEEYLIAKAAERAFGLDWDLERQAVQMKIAEIEKKKLIKKDKLFRLSTVTTLVPHYKGAYSPKIGR